MIFSERMGFVKVAEAIQVRGMSDDLRNSLWNLVLQRVFRGGRSRVGSTAVEKFVETVWGGFFKHPLDSGIQNPFLRYDEIREYFFECEWFDVYDFVEFCVVNSGSTELVGEANAILQRESSGYRIVNGLVAPIMASEDIEAVDGAIGSEVFPGASRHIQAALALLSNRTSPDYRNTIKESICAVESAAYSILGRKKCTLSDALRKLAESHSLHPALSKGFDALYGYTSDKDGIRHAMLDEPDLTQADAVFFLVSCSCFVNYLGSLVRSKPLRVGR